MKSRFSSPGRLCAFSLVEVTLAIGIVSFALLAVVALLPVGLQSVKNSTEQAAAAAVMESLSEALRHSESKDGTNFTVVFNNSTNTFTAGGEAPEPWEWSNLTLEGINDPANRRIVARLEILETPTVDGLQPGRAQASVAWSANRNPDFNPSTRAWENAEGSLTAPVHFLPGRP